MYFLPANLYACTIIKNPMKNVTNKYYYTFVAFYEVIKTIFLQRTVSLLRYFIIRLYKYHKEVVYNLGNDSQVCRPNG